MGRRISGRSGGGRSNATTRRDYGGSSNARNSSGATSCFRCAASTVDESRSRRDDLLTEEGS